METLDYRGKRCPLPVIGLAKRLRGANAGTQVAILADDPAAKVDIPAWCRMRNAELESTTEKTDCLEFVVRQK